MRMILPVLSLAVLVGTMCVAQTAPKPATLPVPTEQDKLLAKLAVFPKDDLWNKDISKEPVDPQSAALIAEIGAGKPLHPDWGAKYGIPFQFVDARTPKITPKFDYPDESDKGPYPIPANVQIEGVALNGPDYEGDRHILCIDAAGQKLYELYHCFNTAGTWRCGSGAIFDLSKISVGQRPKGWTSADAAGLPIFPGLVRYDEVCIKKEITHAVRFTVVKTRRAYVAPATHWASNTSAATFPPMGLRVRLKASFDITGYPPDAQVILKALKTYGMILADNGSDWYITGANDPRWNDDNVNTLKKVKGGDLEVVKMGALTGG